MTTAGRRHTASRATTAVVLLAVAMWAGWRINSRMEAKSLVNQLATAKPSEVLTIARQLQPHLAIAIPRLTRLIEQPAENAKQLQQQTHARIVAGGE